MLASGRVGTRLGDRTVNGYSWALRGAGALLLAACTACAAQPGPAPIEAEPATSSVSAAPTSASETSTSPTLSPVAAATIRVGMDPITDGFNPHLVVDDHPTVATIAELTLPSAFVRGVMDTNLLVSAEEVQPASTDAQTIKYVIRQEAQWSDGTPITGADFSYLWRELTSRPGVLGAAPYRAISAIDVSEGGKTVTVHLMHRVAQWDSLFHWLLPSHLSRTNSTTFETLCQDGVVASGGRFSFLSYDRVRGVATLVRNDRYWGSNPAQLEQLQFLSVHSATQAVEMLRSGQISALDLTPSQTNGRQFNLLPGIQQRSFDRASQLELTFNATSQLLRTPEQRAAVLNELNLYEIAALGLQRDVDLGVAEPLPRPEVAPETTQAVRLASVDRPLRIAVASREDSTLAAQVAIADMLRSKGFTVDISAVDPAAIATGINDGTIDAVLGWRRIGFDPGSAVTTQADFFQCGLPLGVNHANMCDPETQGLVWQLLDGDPAAAEALTARSIQQVISQPIVIDRRLAVLGRGILGPSPELAEWSVYGPAGLFTGADMWRVDSLSTTH